MYQFLNNEIIRRRVETNIDPNWQITAYGDNNLYPQIMQELYKKSPLTKSAIQILTEFIAGEGWTSNALNQINRFGQTWNDILRISANEFSTYNGFALHLNFDGLGKVVEVQHMPFEFVRLGMTNTNGITTYCMVSSNWEENGEKHTKYSGVNPVRYQLFNPKTAAEETIKGGRGQILYYTPQMFTYPLCSFDAVRDSVQVDSELQTYSLSRVQGGFLGTTIFRYPGGFDSAEEKNRLAQTYELPEEIPPQTARFINSIGLNFFICLYLVYNYLIIRTMQVNIRRFVFHKHG